MRTNTTVQARIQTHTHTHTYTHTHAHTHTHTYAYMQEVVSAVELAVADNDELRITRGRKVLEIRPKVRTEAEI